MGGLEKKFWETNKAVLEAAPSFLLMTNTQLFDKSTLGSQIMQSRSPNSTVSTPVTPQTVRNVLKDSGFYSATKKKVPMLKKTHRQNWLEFAHYHENWTVEDFKRVSWRGE